MANILLFKSVVNLYDSIMYKEKVKYIAKGYKANWVPIESYAPPKLEAKDLKGKVVTKKEHKAARERKSALTLLIP